MKKAALAAVAALSSTAGSGGESVKVAVRCRPMNGKERKRKCTSIISIERELSQIQLHKPEALSGGFKEPPKAFTFDAVYDETSTQREVYDEIAAPLVESVLQGYNGTVFAYGQTGCGKTFTMEGENHPPELQGIIPNAFRHIFDAIAINEDEGKRFLVSASYIEIYNEEVRDLLGDDPTKSLQLKESPDRGVFVKGLKENIVDDAEAIHALMVKGGKNRAVAATDMNADSSRSHSIFTVHVETSEPSTDDGDDSSRIRAGKLNLVDLAGSERQNKTQATGARLREATKINLSLSALGNVISALVSAKRGRHVPYRDSKLTRLLQDSLGGNTKTIMVAAISPADYNYDETLSTLRYANRAKNIKNKPKINQDPKDALLRQYEDEIARLKAMLESQAAGAAPANAAAPGSRHLAFDGNQVSLVESDDESDAGGGLKRQLSMANIEAAKIAEAKEESERRARELEAKIEEERKERERLASKLAAKTEAEETREAELAAKLEEERQRAAALAAEVAAKQRQEAELAAQLTKQQQEAEAENIGLKERLEALQNRLLGGAQEKEEAETAKMREKLRKAALKLKLERKKRAEERAQQAQIEDERMLLERSYSSVKEEVEDKTRKLQLLTTRLHAARSEVDDLQNEFDDERQDLLSTIREQGREMQLYQQLLEFLMPGRELELALTHAEWDEDKGQWKLPRFNAPQVLPKLAIRPDSASSDLPPRPLSGLAKKRIKTRASGKLSVRTGRASGRLNPIPSETLSARPAFRRVLSADGGGTSSVGNTPVALSPRWDRPDESDLRLQVANILARKDSPSPSPSHSSARGHTPSASMQLPSSMTRTRTPAPRLQEVLGARSPSPSAVPMPSPPVADSKVKPSPRLRTLSYSADSGAD